MNRITCNCENGKYLASIMDDSAIMCDKIIDADAGAKAKLNNKAEPNDEETNTNFNEKKAVCKT